MLKQYGPAVLVPSAWLVGLLSYLDFIGPMSIEAMNILMTLFLVFFVSTGWKEMEEEPLKSWRLVVAAGIPVSVLASYSLVTAGPKTFLVLEPFFWMLAPAYGFWKTAENVADHTWGNRFAAYSGVLAAFSLSTYTVFGLGSVLCAFTVAGLTQPFGLWLAITPERMP